MTVTAWKAGTPVPVRIGTPDPRTELVNAARNRYRLDPADIAATLDQYAPGLRPEHRWHWLDHLADLADRHDLFDVTTTDDAVNAFIEANEGPWFEALPEAHTRRDEISAEIDRLVGEAQ